VDTANTASKSGAIRHAGGPAQYPPHIQIAKK
jgi:hypothetical protein